MVPKADHDEGGRRGGSEQLAQAADAVAAQDRLVDDHDEGRYALEETRQIGDVGDRRERLDVRLGLQQGPECATHAGVTRRQEDRDARPVDRCGCC